MRATIPALALLPLLALPAAAQLPSASAAASALGESYTALARGANAPAWNPAALGLRGNPRWSLGLFGARADGGLDPIGLEAIARYDGQALPDAARDEWMAAVEKAGREHMEGAIGITPVALSVGRVAFQLGTEMHGIGEIAPDAVELMLYGNAGRTGTTRDLSFAGTRFLATAVTTGAVSYAHPISIRLGPLPEQRFSVGATAKYIVGNALAMGRDAGGFARTTPLEVSVDFPVVQSDSSGETSSLDHGHGLGLDVGASWQGGPFTASAVVQNLANSFRWSPDEMYWRAGSARYDADSSVSSFDDPRALATAPDAVRAEVADLRYARVVALGGAWALSPRVTLVADARQRVGEGRMNAGPKSHLGVGAELHPLRYLPVRLGASAATGGYRLAGGLGLEVGTVNLNLSAGRRFGGNASSAVGALTFGISTR